MRIRTITLGVHMEPPRMDGILEDAGAFLENARERFIDSGIQVQTVRLATQGWGSFTQDLEDRERITLFSDIDRGARKAGIDYVSIGPALTGTEISLVPYILKATEATCCSAFTGDVNTGPVEHNVLVSAVAVLEAAKLSGDGSFNFRFASIANCPSGIPFFPAAYHGGAERTWSVGLECGDLVRTALRGSDRLKDIKDSMFEQYKDPMGTIDEIASGIEGARFAGIDPSTAPSLEVEGSVAYGISDFMGVPFGSPGTLAVCAEITKALHAMEGTVGYSGLMLPVMEDRGLAEGADNGAYNVRDLLSYSSVCGTGLDTVPVPGTVDPSALRSTIMDMTSLAIRLNKPLSARILPIPGAGPGDRSDLGSPHLINCRVLEI